MHTVWVRLNAVVFFGLSVLLSLSCLAALSKIGHASKHQPGELGITFILCVVIFLILLVVYSLDVYKLELNTLKSLKSHGGVDRALLSFDILADMEPAFHWNIKQLFVYVVASYETPMHLENKVVLWDKIIQASDANKMIDEENVFVKYALVDQGGDSSLLGRNVELRLMWDHMPITGLLHMDGQSPESVSSFTLPTTYDARP
eukprot:CAMPEP_0116853602 /NCGR_PEP_ID=MMETSP0418-20121206/18022_1 /TAXON_ID=1158023 /ORGANISM="Astrosyne radiata, Strain 13vi08-1A" /LENGTH=202 /DNA_ID=CAMNT_0004486059 /DNA_START=123 /DNA_END=727 /DNA_ORIENTATION=+